MPRRLIALLTAVLVLTPVASARAGWVPAVAIDGPSADVLEVGNVDLARDGAGAVAYLRNDGGVPHVFISRIVGGAWRAPERLDYTSGPATEAKLAVGDGNRVAVAWVADGNVYATVADGGAFAAPVQIGGPDARSVDIDLGVNGAAYAIWEQAGDVRAARLQDATWTGLAQPLDVEVALPTGTGAGRPRVAVSAEGYAVGTWGDVRADGFTRVWARRMTGLNLSVAPQELTIVGGGSADSPEIDIEDDGSFAWVVFRQEFGGLSRSFGRRLIGSLFEAPETIDGGLASDEPRVDMNGKGVGQAVAQAYSGAVVLGSWLDHDHFVPAARLDGGDSTIPSKPEVVSTDRGASAVAWRKGLGDGNSIARARFRDAEVPFGAEVTVSRDDLGPVADPGVFIAADRVGDFAVAMVQGAPGARALVIGAFDRPPSAPTISNSQSYKRKTRPELRWQPGLDLWGQQTFRVTVDGVVIGQTTSESLVPVTPLLTGTHKWQVEAIDRAGQVTKSKLRTMRIDATAPVLTVRVSGKRAAGQALKISVSARDSGGSGLDHVTVDYGDRSAKTQVASTRHRYKRGSFTLKVAAVDKAGNVARKQVELRIKKS